MRHRETEIETKRERETNTHTGRQVRQTEKETEWGDRAKREN
jgi:hypothetical protein